MDSNRKNICKDCKEICDFIEQLDVESKDIYLKSLITIRYKKRETIIKQNNHSTHLIYLKSGLVKVFTERNNDKNIILKIITPNNFINLSELCSDIYNFSCVALKDCEICLMPKEQFLNLINHNKNLTFPILELYSKFTKLLLDKISSLGTKQMHGRLADVILYLCGIELNNTDVFDFLTRRDIAEMSGMSSESAIRLLTEFKNDGLIKTNGKKIEINNLELITRLSEIG